MATDWGITGIPWMQKIDSASVLTDDGKYYGWHANQNMHQRSIMKIGTKDYTLSGEKFYTGTTASGSSGGDSNDLWGDKGCYVSVLNAKNYNTSFYFGAGTNTSEFFDNDTYYYPSNSICSRALAVIGWGARWTCAGSFSDNGGSAQAYPQKVCLFYADPHEHYKRVVIDANEKKSGNYTLGNKFNNNSTYYNSYMIPTSKIDTVGKGDYIYMGMGVQFYHGSKTKTHTSTCTMKNVRLICGDGAGLVTTPNRIQVCSYPSTLLKDWKNQWDMLTSL